MKYLLLALLMTGCATNSVPKGKAAPAKRFSRTFNLESAYCPIITHGEFKRTGDSYIYPPQDGHK